MANFSELKASFSQGTPTKSSVFKATKITAPTLTVPKPSPISPVIKTPKITPTISQGKGWDTMSAWDKTKAFLNEIPGATWITGKSIVSGAIGSASSMLSGGEWISKKVGAPAVVTDLFKGTGDMTNEWAKELASKNPIFAQKVMSGIGSAATFFVPGLGAAKLTNVVTKFSPKIAFLLGNTVMTGLESMAEAGSVYKEKLAQGADEKDASDAATKTAVANASLIFLTNKFGLFSGKQRGIIKSVLMSAPIEGFQEYMQEAIANVNTGKPWHENALESGMVGALIGGPMGLISATALPGEQAKIPTVKTQIPKEPEKAREWIANNAQQNIIRYFENKQPEAVTRTATTMQPTETYQPEAKPFDLDAFSQRVSYLASTKPEGAKYISETKISVENARKVYRGIGVAGKEIKQGNLGSGIYVSAGKIKGGGKTEEYFINPKAKILQADSKEFIDIKQKNGLEYWEAPATETHAKMITNDVKKLGYDGVESLDKATGIVIFDKKNLLTREEVSEAKPKARTTEEISALNKALKSYKYNLVLQVARYSKDSADIIKNLDFKNASSLEEA
ncbi:MAG: hypothetical protein V1788_00800, partial [Nanoarchaeota archaeon]